MSLITTANLLALTDKSGDASALLLPIIDQLVVNANDLTTLVDSAFPSDPYSRRGMETYSLGLTGQPGQAGIAPQGFGAGGLTGFSLGAGSFGAGAGILSRQALLSAIYYSWIDGGLRGQLRLEASGIGNTAILDLITYAAYYNSSANSGGAPFTVLYSAAFATLYWYVYNGINQLAPSSVFAPAGINLGTATITAANVDTFAPGVLPTANGYASPAPTTDSYGNPVYLGGTPMAQGFAAVKTLQVQVTTAINGTAVLSVTALNQNNVAEVWTATVSNLAVGQATALTPTTSGDRMSAAPTACSVAGTATAGAAQILTLAERAS